MSTVTVIVHDHPAAGQAPHAPLGASAGRQGCARHDWLCAYSGSEPGRCPQCHLTWDAIAAPSNPPGWAAAPAPRIRLGATASTASTPAGSRPTPPARRDPCDYPAEALCLVCGHPNRCDRFYLAEWRHIAPGT